MSDHYRTDGWLVRMVGQHYDPCPYNPLFDVDRDENGLATDWVHESLWCNGRVFVNPPYSNILAWVTKAIYEHEIGGCTIIMLLKHDSSTKWYSLLHQAGAHFLPIIGRLKHCTGKSANFPSVLAVLSDEGDF